MYFPCKMQGSGCFIRHNAHKCLQLAVKRAQRQKRKAICTPLGIQVASEFLNLWKTNETIL